MPRGVGLLVGREVAAQLRRHRALVLLTALLVALLLGCNGIIGAGISRHAESVQYQSALNLIELSSAAPSARQELTDQTLAPLRSLPGVVGVYPWFQVDLALTNSSDWPQPDVNPGSLWVTTMVPGLTPPVLLGAIPSDGLSGTEIALPHHVEGGDLDRLLGKRVTMEYTKVTGRGEGEPMRKQFLVVAIVDNSTPSWSTPGEAGPQASYLNATTMREMVRRSNTLDGQDTTYSSAYVRVADPALVPSIRGELSQQGFEVRSVAEQLRSLNGLFRVLSLAGWIFGALLLVVCLGVGVAVGTTRVGSAWVRQRTRELGLLKAIGWTRRRLLLALVLELTAVGAVAAVAGILVGTVGSLVGTTVIAGLHLDLLPVDPWGLPAPGLLLVALLAVPACVCLGGLRIALRTVRIDADDALRDL